MHVVIVPGFLGHPSETAFQELRKALENRGHSVTEIAWPHFPGDMARYSLSETINHARDVIQKIPKDDLVLLGHSMGGIIATLLASEYQPAKLILVVSPYHVGNEGDLAGKYKDWQATGYRDAVSSVHGGLRIPFSFVEDARKYNALDCIANVHCPALFIVGELDDKNPPAVTRKLFDRVNEPKSWHEIPGMQHRYQYQSQEMLEKVNDAIINFIG